MFYSFRPHTSGAIAKSVLVGVWGAAGRRAIDACGALCDEAAPALPKESGARNAVPRALDQVSLIKSQSRSMRFKFGEYGGKHKRSFATTARWACDDKQSMAVDSMPEAMRQQ